MSIWPNCNQNEYCIFIIDIPSLQLSTNAPKYVVEGTVINFTCQAEDYLVIPLIQTTQLIKDGNFVYQWQQKSVSKRFLTTTLTHNANVSDSGKYQCKGIVGAASKFSSPFHLIVGRKRIITFLRPLRAFNLTS